MPKFDREDLAAAAAKDPRYKALFAELPPLSGEPADWDETDPRVSSSQMRLDAVHRARAAKAEREYLAAQLLPPTLTDAFNRRQLAKAQSEAIAALAEEREAEAREEREREQDALDAEAAKLEPMRELRAKRRAARAAWMADNGGSF